MKIQHVSIILLGYDFTLHPLSWLVNKFLVKPHRYIDFKLLVVCTVIVYRTSMHA